MAGLGAASSEALAGPAYLFTIKGGQIAYQCLFFYSDDDFRLGLNAGQTTLGAIARLSGATLSPQIEFPLQCY